MADKAHTVNISCGLCWVPIHTRPDFLIIFLHMTDILVSMWKQKNQTILSISGSKHLLCLNDMADLKLFLPL